MPEEQKKLCSRCKQEKPLAAFYKTRREKDGHHVACKACESAAGVAYRKNYYAKNKKRMQATAAAWKKAHPDQRRIWDDRWVSEHPERFRANQRRWRKNHPEAGRAASRKRRALRRGAPGEGFTAADEAAVLAYWGWKCAYCPCDLRTLPRGEIHMDHVTPLVHGGAHSPENIVPSCDPCNRKKGSRGVFFIKNGAWCILPALAPYAKAA